MRSKSPLALMEQLVMVLVFALAAALCLRAFVLADQTSRYHADVDRSVLLCQNAAETLKATGLPMAEAQEAVMAEMGGILRQGLLQICYDEKWNPLPGSPAECAYVLEIQGVPADVEGLWKAHIRVAAEEDISAGGSGESLFELYVAWQEVG